MNAFQFRDYRFYWCSRLFATVAQMAMVIVIGWQVYDIARSSLGMSERESAFQLGLIGLAQFLPLLVLTPVSGWLIDRIDRRQIARASIALELICALTLTFATDTGALSLQLLFVIAALLGVARAFAGPALQALSPNLVPREVLPSAVAYGSIAWQTGAITGPALGGFLYAYRPDLPYSVSAILFALALMAMFAVRPVKRSIMTSNTHPLRQMIEGLHYVRHNRIVLGAMSLDLFAVLLGGATAMLPVYARDVLHVGAEGLGQLRAAPSLGAVLIAGLLAWQPLSRRVGVVLIGSVVVFGIATIVFGLSTNMPIALAMLALLGGADMLSVYIRQTLIQLHTPDNMRGRVGAVSTLFISGSNELGEAESGFLAAVAGPVVSVVVGGIGAIGIGLAWIRLFPELYATQNFDQPDSVDG